VKVTSISSENCLSERLSVILSEAKNLISLQGQSIRKNNRKIIIYEMGSFVLLSRPQDDSFKYSDNLLKVYFILKYSHLHRSNEISLHLQALHVQLSSGNNIHRLVTALRALVTCSGIKQLSAVPAPQPGLHLVEIDDCL
jgi:hypothetical protein